MIPCFSSISNSAILRGSGESHISTKANEFTDADLLSRHLVDHFTSDRSSGICDSKQGHHQPRVDRRTAPVGEAQRKSRMSHNASHAFLLLLRSIGRHISRARRPFALLETQCWPDAVRISSRFRVSMPMPWPVYTPAGALRPLSGRHILESRRPCSMVMERYGRPPHGLCDGRVDVIRWPARASASARFPQRSARPGWGSPGPRSAAVAM